MAYIKENGSFIYLNHDGTKLFSTAIVGLLTVNGKVTKHGSVAKLEALYIQMMTSGQQVQFIKSGDFDLNNLNQLTAGISPEI